MTKKHNGKHSKPSVRQDQMRRLLSEIQQKKYKNILVMTGAGISTAAGIPDFRSPETGLYANLQKYNLPYPEAVFDISYLRKNPEPFFLLAGEMYPSQFQPTTFHRLIKWISDLGCLKRVFTQNIDTLERLAGIPDEQIIEAHGSFATSRCIKCKHVADMAFVEEEILVKKAVPKCTTCKGIVKPDIVFFGEALPDRFTDNLDDTEEADLAIVAGTSLQVGPFNQLPEMIPKDVPRWLLNQEQAGSLGRRKRDELILGPLEDLDEVILEFIDADKTDRADRTDKADKSDKSDEQEKKKEKKTEEEADITAKLDQLSI